MVKVRKCIGVGLFLALSILLTGCSSTKSESWTLFVYDNNNELEDVYNGYDTLSLCWDGAVTATNRGQQFFECGRNCGELAQVTNGCDYICKQYDLSDCEEDLDL